MDGPRTTPDQRPGIDVGARAWTGCATVIVMLAAAFLLGRCTAPAAATPAPPEPGIEQAASPDVAHVEAVIAAAVTTFVTNRTAAAPTAVPPAATPADRWDALAACETGGNWAADTGNGFHGGLQFAPSTWTSMGGLDFAPTADQATKDQQIHVAEKVLAVVGWKAWPGCSSKLGWR